MFFVGKKIEKNRSNIIEKLNLPREKNAFLMWIMKKQIKTAALYEQPQLIIIS